MDYQKLKYFLKAAETLNFSKAAKELYITPQSFGKQITLLEQAMGFPLFERSTRQLRLTAAGKIVYNSLNGMVNELEREYEKICAMGSKRSRQIQIGVFNALSRSKIVSPAVNGILANYPKQDISICMRDMSDLARDIVGGDLDLGITVTHDAEPQWRNCETIPLVSSPAQIVVSKYHPWYMKDTVTVEEMRQRTFLRMKMPDFMRNELFYIVPCKNVTEVDNYETLCLLLDQGECFTVLSSAVDRYCEQHGKGLPLPCDNFDFSLSLVYSKSNPHPFLPELCAFIQETLEP